MKILKYILIVVAILIVIPLVVALFVKKEYRVERVVVINQPKDVVYDYVKLLKNQNEFSKWANMDPNMDKSFTGTDGTVGFVSAWESKDKHVGKGEQEIIKITDDRIDYELRFLEPMESTESAYLTFQKLSDNQTQVLWGFNGKMSYPSNIMFLFMNFEKMIGDDLATGLSNLKAILEK
jgi:hypothetical protein